MVHHEDMADAFRLAVERRFRLPPETVILVGEPDPMGYAALQDRLGELLHGEEWLTLRVPQVVAAAGAWVEGAVLPHLPNAIGGGNAPFVQPFMAWEGSDHYALDISRAADLLGWSPKHHLETMLPGIVAGLKHDPKAWYQANHVAWNAAAG